MTPALHVCIRADRAGRIHMMLTPINPELTPSRARRIADALNAAATAIEDGETPDRWVLNLPARENSTEGATSC